MRKAEKGDKMAVNIPTFYQLCTPPPQDVAKEWLLRWYSLEYPAAAEMYPSWKGPYANAEVQRNHAIAGRSAGYPGLMAKAPSTQKHAFKPKLRKTLGRHFLPFLEHTETCQQSQNHDSSERARNAYSQSADPKLLWKSTAVKNREKRIKVLRFSFW